LAQVGPQHLLASKSKSTKNLHWKSATVIKAPRRLSPSYVSTINTPARYQSTQSYVSTINILSSLSKHSVLRVDAKHTQHHVHLATVWQNTYHILIYLHHRRSTRWPSNTRRCGHLRSIQFFRPSRHTSIGLASQKKQCQMQRPRQSTGNRPAKLIRPSAKTSICQTPFHQTSCTGNRTGL